MRQSPPPRLTAELDRKKLVTLVLNLTQGTVLAPRPKEKLLLEKYGRGEFTLDQMLARLPAPEFERPAIS